jgi:hypothetical protein
VAAPRQSASSSIIFQFSGPFNPLPADTTTSASDNEILPLFTSLPVIEMLEFNSSSFTSILEETTFSTTLNALGEIVITPQLDFNRIDSIALDEKDCLLTEIFSKSLISEITFVIKPAFNFTETLGAILLALNVFEKIVRLLFSDSFLIIAATPFSLFFLTFGYETIVFAP